MVIKIEKADKSDLAEIKALALLLYGKICANRLFMRKNRFCLKAVERGEIIGFISGGMQEVSYEIDQVNGHLPPFIEEAERQETLGQIKAICVMPGKQKHGIGTALVEAMEAALQEKGATFICLRAWADPSGIHMEKTITEHGYRGFHKAIKPWKKECDNDRFHCPSRTDHCVCDALYYYKNLAV